jgi:hypothetical protein
MSAEEWRRPSRLYVFHAQRRLVLPIPGGRPKTPLPKKLTFEHPQKIIELAERGGYSMHLEERQSLGHKIENGRGGIWLLLTEEQYAKLKR